MDSTEIAEVLLMHSPSKHFKALRSVSSIFSYYSDKYASQHIHGFKLNLNKPDDFEDQKRYIQRARLNNISKLRVKCDSFITGLADFLQQIRSTSLDLTCITTLEIRNTHFALRLAQLLPHFPNVTTLKIIGAWAPVTLAQNNRVFEEFKLEYSPFARLQDGVTYPEFGVSHLSTTRFVYGGNGNLTGFTCVKTLKLKMVQDGAVCRANNAPIRGSDLIIVSNKLEFEVTFSDARDVVEGRPKMYDSIVTFVRTMNFNATQKAYLVA